MYLHFISVIFAHPIVGYLMCLFTSKVLIKIFMYVSVIPRETPNIAGNMMSPTIKENHTFATDITVPHESSILPRAPTTQLRQQPRSLN